MVPKIEGEIEIILDDVLDEGSSNLGESAREFRKRMESSGSRLYLQPTKEVGDKPACECCGRSDRKLWNGVCAWCCP